MKFSLFCMIASSLAGILFCSKSKNKPDFPLLDKLKPANQYFHVNPLEKNLLRAEKGSFFTIEPDSFALPEGYQRGEMIEIHLIEVTKSIEFSALPISLEIEHKGTPTLFESAGMFFINATYKNKPLALRPGKKIEVKFRTDIQGEEFYVYNHDAEKGWQRHGHNQEIWLIAAPRKAVPPRPFYVKPAVAKAARALYRVYKIDRLTWWNFDYPKPDLTCLKGKVSGSDSQSYSVTVFSKSELGAYTLQLPKDFKISFYRNTTARIFVIDEKGNVARTSFFETSDEIGHHKLPDSKCEDVGPLKMETIPPEVLNDEVKLKKYFQKAGDGT